MNVIEKELAELKTKLAENRHVELEATNEINSIAHLEGKRGEPANDATKRIIELRAVLDACKAKRQALKQEIGELQHAQNAIVKRSQQRAKLAKVKE